MKDKYLYSIYQKYTLTKNGRTEGTGLSALNKVITASAQLNLYYTCYRIIYCTIQITFQVQVNCWPWIIKSVATKNKHCFIFWAFRSKTFGQPHQYTPIATNTCLIRLSGPRTCRRITSQLIKVFAILQNCSMRCRHSITSLCCS